MSIYPPVHDEMIRLLSVPRLGTYSAACGGDVKKALELYRWNLDASMAFFEAIHYFEVAFRNTIDTALTRWIDTTGDKGLPWFDSSNARLTGTTRHKISEAKGRVTRAGHNVTRGRVVAELTLGFWSKLLSESYNRTLWQKALKDAFPQARRERLHDEVEEIVKLRNRIAHHEHLLSHDLHAEYARIMATAEYVTPRLAWWIDSTSRVDSILRKRPS